MCLIEYLSDGKDSIRGRPASPGETEGRTLVIKDGFINNVNYKNSQFILVLKKLDPSYTPLIPSSKGIISESGSLGSHIVKICLEFEKPCIVQVENACEIMSEWEYISMNGMTGVISRINGNLS